MNKESRVWKGAAALSLAVGLTLGAVGAQAGAYEDFLRAVSRDDASTVQRLLQQGLDPNTRDEQGQTALFVALRGESWDVARALLAHPQLQVDETNASGETALMMAALRGRADWIDTLLKRGARVHQAGWSPVLYAAGSPNPQALALLLDRGAPVDARAPNGTTPLMMAARYGDERSVDLLLARGADARLRNDHRLTAADFARQGGRERLAERLQALVR